MTSINVYIFMKLTFVIQNGFKEGGEEQCYGKIHQAKDPNLMYNMKLICMWPISLHFH